jgi:hypothetical protein
MAIMKEKTRNRLLVTAGAALLPFALSAALHAQQPDGRWVGWLGCWQALELTADRAGEQLCIVPTATFDGVEMATVRAGEIVARETVRANGERIANEKEGCTGWESAHWSADSHRVYFRSEYVCEGGTTRVSTGLVSFASPNEWLDVQVVNVGDENAARVLRYRPVRANTLLPVEIERALVGRDLAVTSARTALASAISVDEVIEATDQVGGAAVAAWVAERGQPFALDGDALRRMGNAGVPPDVVDMVVAVSHPDVFQVDRTTLENERRAREPRNAEDYAYPGYRDPYGRYIGWDPFYRYGAYSLRSYYYSPYGVGTRYGWNYGYRPIIVVIGDDAFDDGRRSGRVVRGRGYTRDPRSTGTSSGTTSSSVGRASASTGSTGTGSAGSSGSTTRKAKARTGSGGGGS